MKEIEILVLQRMLITLRLRKAEREYGNKYVFGFDDTQGVFQEVIGKLLEENKK